MPQVRTIKSAYYEDKSYVWNMTHWFENICIIFPFYKILETP